MSLKLLSPYNYDYESDYDPDYESDVNQDSDSDSDSESESEFEFFEPNTKDMDWISLHCKNCTEFQMVGSDYYCDDRKFVTIPNFTNLCVKMYVAKYSGSKNVFVGSIIYPTINDRHYFYIESHFEASDCFIDVAMLTKNKMLISKFIFRASPEKDKWGDTMEKYQNFEY